MAALKAGEPKVWEDFLESYNSLVCATIQRTGGFTAGQETLVNDIRQDVFLAVIRDINKLKDPDALKWWVVRIAINITTDWIRQTVKQRKVFVAPPTDRETGETMIPEPVGRKDPSTDLMGREDIRKIEECLEKLRESHSNWWEIVTRRCLNDMEFCDIAAGMGVLEITVRSGLHKARKLLWNCIFGEQTESPSD